MRRVNFIGFLTLFIGSLCSASLASAQVIFPIPFPVPTVGTDWTPEGCRQTYSNDPVFAKRIAFRQLHANEINTDEVGVAVAPFFERGASFETEPNTWHFSGPMFDDDGNIYYSAVQPFEALALVSLTPDGTRRWAIPNTTGAPQGPSGPHVLDDPDNPGEQIVYLGLYDRAIAVKTDGTVIWDVATGLPSENAAYTFGINYQPQHDALVVNTQDGFLYALDRKTGDQLLSEPFQLPGEVSPAVPVNQPPALQACAAQKFQELVNVDLAGFQELIDVLLGNSVEVANFFSIEPRSGRIFVPATAPDGDDGTVDGVSEFGALYGLELQETDHGIEMVEVCRKTFAGGSASTPALNPDGTRVYFGDNFGTLIAIDQDCNDAWTLDVGDQIFGSIGVSSDNDELYASFDGGIVQVIDEGSQGVLNWRQEFDLFTSNVLPPAAVTTRNLNLVGIGANGAYFLAGGSLVTGVGEPLVVTTGVGVLDRDTGAVRYFAGGLDESIAVMSTGPDGVLNMGNSPTRRVFTICAGELGLIPFPVPPPAGGITRWEPQRLDLLIRDAVCAAEDRARNAFQNLNVCAPGVAQADIVQIGQLVDQARAAGPTAVAAGDLTSADWARIEKELDKADRKLDPDKPQHLNPATQALRRACNVLEDSID
jgi:outer membrane protein assembly factor BamB